MESFIISKETKATFLIVFIGICIVGISILLASLFHMTADNTLELANIFATSIVGSAALAIAVNSFTKKP